MLSFRFQSYITFTRHAHDSFPHCLWTHRTRSSWNSLHLCLFKVNNTTCLLGLIFWLSSCFVVKTHEQVINKTSTSNTSAASNRAKISNECDIINPLVKQFFFSKSQLYRDRLKLVHQVWWILLLLLLITSASICRQHSQNLVHRLQPISVDCKK